MLNSSKIINFDGLIILHENQIVNGFSQIFTFCPKSTDSVLCKMLGQLCRMTMSWVRERRRSHRVRPPATAAERVLTPRQDRVQRRAAAAAVNKQIQDGRRRKEENKRLYQAKESVTARMRKVIPRQRRASRSPPPARQARM
jgi:hypothetical protein